MNKGMLLKKIIRKIAKKADPELITELNNQRKY